MHQIKAKHLTAEGFRKYGVFQNLFDNESLAQNSIRKSGFFPDLITLNFGRDTLPSVCLCHVKKADRMILSFLESHSKTCEGLLPIDSDIVIYVGISGGAAENWSVTDCEAFIIPKGTFVKLEPFILHGTQYPVNAEEARVLCMLPERTFNNDTMAKRIENDGDKAEIILGTC